MRAVRATAQSEKRNHVMPYSASMSVLFGFLQVGEGWVRGLVLPGRYSAKAGSPSPWTMPLYAARRHHRRGRGAGARDLTEEVRDAGCVVRSKDRFVGGQLPSDRGETRGTRKRGRRQSGRRLPHDQRGQGRVNPCAPPGGSRIRRRLVLLGLLERGEVVFWSGCNPPIWERLPLPARLPGRDWLRIA